MATTTNGFRYPVATDTPDVPRDVGNLAADVESKLGQNVVGATSGAWTSYAPAWTAATTNPVIGNGSIVGAWKKIGRTVFWRVTITMGSTTTYGVGTWYVSLPDTLVGAMAASGFPVGNWAGTPAGNRSNGVVTVDSVTTRAFFQIGGAATVCAAAVPFTWASGNVLMVQGSFETAA